MLRNHRKIKLRSCSFCTEQTAAAQSEFNLNLMALSDRIYADTDSSKYSSRFWTLHTDSSFGFKRTVDQTAKRWDWKQSGDSVTDSLTFIAGWYQTLTHTHESHDWTERSVWQEVAEEPSSDLCLIRVRLFLSSLSFFVVDCWSDSVAETATDRFTSWACSSFWPRTVQVHRKEAVTDFFHIKRLI